tara:strand:+ start:896 stop:1528 length:633 start_codon:yes stop_codon:yes gene_type:complete
MPTTAELTEEYIMKHPSIKDCLVKGIINFSSLSRIIAKELSVDKKTSKEAILMAVIRLKDKIKKEKTNEEEIINLMKNNELEFKTKVFTIIAEKTALHKIIDIEQEIRKSGDPIYIIEGTKSFTLISSVKHYTKLHSLLKNYIIKENKNLVLVIIKSDRDIEKIKGVMSTFCTALYENDINIIDTMSCWTDTIFLIEEEDLQKMMKALSF